MSKNLIINVDEISHENDAGYCAYIICPDCKESVLISSGQAWWDSTCKCGYEWKLHLIASPNN